MNKKLLVFLFFLTSLFVQGQNEYGLLIRSTMNSKTPGTMTTRYTIEGRKTEVLVFSTRNIQPLISQEMVQYDFFYTKDINELYFLALEQKTNGQVNCSKEYTIPYNPAVSTQENFGGCVGNSVAWTIHLKQPSSNNLCADDVVTLTNGWDWQYQYDATGWKPMPSQFQGKRSITFSLKDIGGYDGKSQIFFQAGYKTQFTNTVFYSIIGCSPELEEKKPTAIAVECSNTPTGSATLKFKTGLKAGNKLLLNLFHANPVAPDTGFITSIYASENEVSNKTYTWKGIAAGTYKIKYQAQSTSDSGEKVGLSAIVTDPFTIDEKTPLTFWATAIPPECSGNRGFIEIHAAGGTTPYYYILDNQTEVINGQTVPKKNEFSGTHQIPITLDGGHTVKIVDKFNCEEQ
ncbi:hypothetical protein [Flavobacterium sp.]|uniref:hypothetical protein n=1 Tax=Flavobacterium sp. TaxID=239 RepID=UPI0025BB2CEF|nr:hypothetical protein [Flavobacterium sp.]